MRGFELRVYSFILLAFMSVSCRSREQSSEVFSEKIIAIVDGLGEVQLELLGTGETGTAYRIVGTDKVLKRAGQSSVQKTLFAAEVQVWKNSTVQRVLGDDIVPAETKLLKSFGGEQVANETILIKQFLNGKTYQQMDKATRTAIQADLERIFNSVKSLSRDHEIQIYDIHDENIMLAETSGGQKKVYIIDGAVNTSSGSYETFVNDCASYGWCSAYATTKTKCNSTALTDLFKF